MAKHVVFFDIGDTLASAEFVGNSLTFHVFDYVKPILRRLTSNYNALLGILSNSHRGDEDDSSRESLTTEAISALRRSGLYEFFHPNLIFLSSETGLRKLSTAPFELAAGRAARIAGVLPNQCVFVGENSRERKFAADAGFEVSVHPVLIEETLQNRHPHYVEISFDGRRQAQSLAASLANLPLLPLQVQNENSTLLCLASKHCQTRIRNAGHSVQMPPRQPDARFSDAFLLRDFNATGRSDYIASSDGRDDLLLRLTDEGAYVAMPCGRSTNEIQVADSHGHTLQLTPKPDFFKPLQASHGFAADRNKLSTQEISKIMAEVTEEAIEKIVQKYSGINSTGEFVTRNRHSLSPDIQKVADALEQDFHRIGQGRLVVTKHRFTHSDGDAIENVIAELPGESDEIVMITAHLDSTSIGSFGSNYDPNLHDAPGADDDASGIAGVMLAAEVFCSLYRDQKPSRTVRFALFNAEEQGLQGSQKYALQQRNSSAKIVGAFQFDMIGYNVELPISFETHAGHRDGSIQQRSLALAQIVSDVTDQLRNLGLVAAELPQLFPEIGGDGNYLPDPADGRSDHASFQDNGFAACVTSGDFFPSHGIGAEPNPNYHTINDTFVAYDFAADITRSICGAALCLASPSPDHFIQSSNGSYGQLIHHRPLVLTGLVCEVASREPAAGMRIQVLSVDAEKILGEATSDIEGAYSIEIPAKLESPIRLEVKDAEGSVVHLGDDLLLSGQATNWQVVVGCQAPRDPVASFVGGRRRQLMSINGQHVETELVKSINAESILEEARKIASGKENGHGFGEAGVLSPPHGFVAVEGIQKPMKYTCGTDRIATLEELARKSGIADAEDVIREMDRILLYGDSGFASVVYESSHFRINYQTSGDLAVDLSTAKEEVEDPGANPRVVLAALNENEPAGGIPTYVKRVAFWLERSLALYTSPPFSMRNPAPPGRKIHANINGSSSGAARPSGFFIGNKLASDFICAVAVHELFHMVQFEYGSGFGPWRDGLVEGGATFAEDTVADKMNRYLDEAGRNFNEGVGLLSAPNQRMSDSNVKYKTSLFWRYVAEQRSHLDTEPTIGVDSYRRILEVCSGGSYSDTDLKSAIRSLPGSIELIDFTYLDTERSVATCSETTLGNFALACYLKDEPGVADSRFTFFENDEPIYITQVVGDPQRPTKLVSVSVDDIRTVDSNTGVNFVGRVEPFGSQFFQADIANDVDSLLVHFRATGRIPGLFQILLMDSNGLVRDIIRSDSIELKKTINCGGLSRLEKLILVTTGNAGGAYQISIGPSQPSSDVMITNWNCQSSEEYHVDPKNTSWSYQSPDITINSGDSTGEFNVSLTIRNKGNADGESVGLDVVYGTTASNWRPLKSANGIVQRIAGERVNRGEAKSFTLRWKPESLVDGRKCILKATVKSPNDVNEDNKVALHEIELSSFSQRDVVRSESRPSIDGQRRKRRL